MKKQRKKEKPSVKRHNCGAKAKNPSDRLYQVQYMVSGRIIEKTTGHEMTENKDSNKVIIAEFKEKSKVVVR